MKKTKIVLNEEYSHLSTFINQLPFFFETEGNLIYEGRNTVKTYRYYNLSINVKRYRRPNIVNKIAYTYIRRSKADRAYHNAIEVLQRQIETPAPIAFIETYRKGFLDYSFFVSIQCEYPHSIRDFYHGPLKGNEPLMTALAQYTAKIHEAGIYHKDLSPGNILYAQEGRKFYFSIIDINRMSFETVGLKKGCRNWERLFDDDEIYTFLAQQYASSRAYNPDICKKLILLYYHKFKRTFRLKKRILHPFKSRK